MTRHVTQQLFLAHLRCKRKSHLKQAGVIGKISDVEILDTRLDEQFRDRAEKHLCASFRGNRVARSPSSITNSVANGDYLITDALVTHQTLAARVDAVIRVDRKSQASSLYVPVLFVRNDKPSKLDRLHLAFCGYILQRTLGKEVGYGRILYGQEFATRRVELASLFTHVEVALKEISENSNAGDPPALHLNAHCQACEFSQQCRSSALEKDDLSLLRGMSEKEIASSVPE